jgi:hypothetical protein
VKPHHSIFKIYSDQVSALGFSRLKTAWWERRQDLILQKIHIHKFTFTTSFRVHAAIHLDGFNEDVHWLNGMSSYDGWFERGILRLPVQRYTFDYSESSSSWVACAESLLDFTREILVPWFDQWPDTSSLQADPDSPLHDEQRAFLARA